MVFKCKQGAVVKENRPPKYKHPASFLRSFKVPDNAEARLQRRARLSPVVLVFQSRLCTKNCELRCCRCGARYRHEHWQRVSAEIGCGGGGSGFGLTDLLQSHLFLWIMRSCASREDLCRRTVSGALVKFKVWVILTWPTRGYILYSRERDEGVGGWYYQALIGAPSLVHSVGVFVGWNGSQLHWGVWASLTVRLSGAIAQGVGGWGWLRSAAAVVSITERSVCMSMCPSSAMPGPRRQPERPCDATHSWLQSAAALAPAPAGRVGWAGGGWPRTRLSRGWRGGF